MKTFAQTYQVIKEGVLIWSIATALALLCFIVGFISCAVQISYAAPSSNSATNVKDLDVGELSDRYDSLNKLENSLNEEEGVVIDTRVAVLVSVNRALDGSEVRFSGEVVGDVVNADPGYKWVNVMGTANNVIGVRMSDEQAKLIQNRGGYHSTGTVLQITGTYHIACPEHQGELDVHAADVVVQDNGGPITHLVSTQRLVVASLLCFIAVSLLFAFILIRRYLERRSDT